MTREDFVEKGQLALLKGLENTRMKGWDSTQTKARIGKSVITDGFHKSVDEAIQVKWNNPNDDDTIQFVSYYVHYEDLILLDDSNTVPKQKPIYFEVQKLVI